MELPKRTNPRLKGYNYGQAGSYFFTVCAFRHQSIFGTIDVGQGLCPCRLTPIGTIIEREIYLLTEKYPGILIDKFVIMPNHLHIIVSIETVRQGQSPCPTPAVRTALDLLRELKSVATKQANRADNTPGRKIFQFRFHDHIIPSQQQYDKIWNYIDTNTRRWEKDRYYI